VSAANRECQVLPQGRRSGIDPALTIVDSQRMPLRERPIFMA